MGTEKLKVLVKVYPNARIRVEAEVVDKRESSKKVTWFLTWAWVLKNQDDVITIQGENT